MATNKDIRIEQVKDGGDLASALAIREIVFIEEQRVPEGLERDEEDAKAYHVLAYEGGHAVGTGRLVTLGAPPAGESGRWGKIGRMAVLAAHRKSGIGRRILNHLEDEARREGMAGIVLHAQLHARDFYARAGYTDASAIFEEAGMDHLEMRKKLSGASSASTTGNGATGSGQGGAGGGSLFRTAELLIPLWLVEPFPNGA